jgi:Tol biopolymer transport system component
MRLPRTTRGRLAIALPATVLVAAGIAFGVATSATPPESGPGVNTHVDHADIWAVNVDTKELTRETLYADAREPSWSPDGEIAFSTADCDECDSEIHLDGTGSTDVQVDTTIRHLYQPSWAPDGDRFAVIRLGHGIWVVNVVTKTAKRLTYGPAEETPAWSPTGEWILYDRLVNSTNYDLFAVNAQTGERRRLTNDSAAQTNPTWSPDGTRLAFAEQQSNGNWSIFTVGFDGKGRKRVTGSEVSAQEPSWSPDGTRIAFILQGTDKASVAVIAANGTGTPTPLTDESLYPSKPTWSPGGTKVAFSALVVPQ